MPVDTSLSPDAAAAAYESLLLTTIGLHPRLDLALMGLGPDGHTASLFPGKPAVAETQRYAVGVPEPGMEPLVPRVTLTLPVFNTAREVVFLVAGADKAPAVRRAFGTPPDESSPAAHVRPGAGTLLVGGVFATSEPVPTSRESTDALVAQLLAQIDAHRGDDARAIAVGVPSVV